MGTLAPSMHFPPNYDEISMQQNTLFSDSLMGLKNLSKQLYSAAEYFELSYTNDDQKQIMVNTLQDYAIKALVNTVDHLGSVSYKVNDLLDEKVDDVTRIELQVSCIEQRLRTCQDYADREGFSQQSLVINTPKYQKKYILPGGESVDTMKETPIVFRDLLPRNPNILQQSESFSFSYSLPNKDSERTFSSHRFPFLRTSSFSNKPSSPIGRQIVYIHEPQKSASMRIHPGKECPKGKEHNPSKSKGLLKSLLSRRKSIEILHSFPLHLSGIYTTFCNVFVQIQA